MHPSCVTELHSGIGCHPDSTLRHPEHAQGRTRLFQITGCDNISLMTTETLRPTLRDRVVRHPRERIISGLSGGIAAELGIPTAYVRAAFVALTGAFGVGIVIYAALSAVAPVAEPTQRRSEPRERLGLVLITLGSLLALRSFGIWFNDEVSWSLALVAFGFAVSWERADPESLRASRGQTIAGSILLVAGLVFAFTSVDALGSIGPVAVAIILTTAGFGLIFGPWLWRLADQLNTERKERIRSDERADVAAHLHDSVLQTLALIQRTEDPKRMVTLARAQERELRDWLYNPDAAEESLAAALKEAVGKVEAAVDVPIELVVVGDAPMSPGVSALVKAAGEAMTNAAKHSESSKVSVYTEVTDTEIEVYVNDQGNGFVRDEVPGDRRGIVESIEGRMQRHGGSAAILSEPGEGTEVHLLMPREAS